MPSRNTTSPMQRNDETGTVLFDVPGYEIREKLSENAAFQVYRAQRNEDLAPVLLKVLNRPYPSPKLLAPLWQEFETLRLLETPGVEKAIALENHQQWWMIVLEDWGGLPIDRLDIAGYMDPEDFLILALQLASILEEVHSHQVIHKNISPSNISFHPDTRKAWLTNFSSASLVSKEKVPVESPYRLAEFLAFTSPEMTGRMNRTVDYRTDYYSLGATLYNLLTGSPPFFGDSLLELVHAHLAILPDPPESRMEPWSSSPAAFRIISSILSKLLAKNPEDRYQTPAALQADLRHCLSVLKEPIEKGSKEEVFFPGQFDRPAELNFPQMVIGRYDETDALVQAFLRSIDGPKEMVLVSGEAGVGKTVLVNELIRPVSEHTGYFLHGKFNQTSHLKIYTALIELLEEFCRLVLSEPAPEFEGWRERIQIAVAPHGHLLTDLCPQLENVIGPQPPVQSVDEPVARYRFHRVVIRFLQAICQPHHPVVIFLDDLQWINADSYLLWQSILADPSLKNLLLVGAYRDEEVGPDHPIHRLAHELEKAGGHLTRITIENLEWPLIQLLVAATLASNPADVSELTTLIYMKTDGNPYLSMELLKSLYKDRLVIFDPEARKWSWDTDRIKEYGTTGNVIQYYVHQISMLDEETQTLLQYAALIGGRFTSASLLAVLGKEKADAIADSLWQTMRTDLIRPLDGSYRLLVGENLESTASKSDALIPSLADLLEEQNLFEFTDDHIQQAAITLLDEAQIRKISLQIGWRLLERAEQAGPGAMQENLLSIVDHLNQGSELIEDPAEALRLAKLNLQASNHVRRVAAFRAAFNYLSSGMQLLPVHSWQDEYELTLEFYTSGAEVALVNGDMAHSEALARIAEMNARTLLEKVWIMRVYMEIYLTQNHLDRVIEQGIAAIRLLEFDLEVGAAPVTLVEKIIYSPDMTDPRALAVSRLIEPLLSAAYVRNTEWFTQFVHFYIDLFSRYGNPLGASFAYIAYGVILLSQFKEVEDGRRIGKLALELAERQGPSRILYSVRFVYYAFIHHWLSPAREAVSPLEENILTAFESGNLEFSKNSQDLVIQNSLLAGYKLEQVRLKQVEAQQRMEMISQTSYRLKFWTQVVLRLMGGPPQSQDVKGSLFDEEDLLLLQAGQNRMLQFNLYAAQAYFSILFRKPQQALEAATSAYETRLDANTHLVAAHHIFIYSLALLSAGLDDGDRSERIKQVNQNLELMQVWASLVPQNFLHQFELVEAELARDLGLDDQAVKSYSLSIQNARRNGFIHDSALAAELAAEFYISREQYLTAIDHLCTAYYSYQAWGASAKIADLVNRYPDWLPPGKENDQRKIISPVADRPADQLGSSIDLITILKASIELAQETSLEELLRKMMAILIENAGAQNGSLILLQNDRWYLKVQGSTDPEQGFSLLSTPLDYLSPQVGKPYIPISIIHYVINLKVDLVLEDASTSRQFNRDTYIQTQRPKSVLCAPLLNQGVLIGVVYLENNLIAGAFTSDRLEMVRLISGQAAVSIEKAWLYETMEMQVQERTRELTDTNRRLKEEINQRILVEDALRLSEEHYRKVFESTGTAMVLIDKDGYLILNNEKFVELSGYPREELENHFNSLEIVSTADLPRIRHEWEAALADPNKIPNSFEFQLVDKSGVIKPVIATTTFLPGSQSIIISLIDITQRKSAEEALRYNEALLRKVLDILPVGIWILDKDARVVKGNPEAFRIWSGAEYIEWQEYDEHKAWRRDTGDEVRPGDWAANRAIANGQAIFNEELEIEAFDGQHKIILNSAMPLTTEQDGLIGAIAVNQDITERKRNEEELKNAHDQLSTLLEISQSIVSILDLDRLLNLIIEQLGKVLPYDAAAILILEQTQLTFRVLRGPVAFHGLLSSQIPVLESDFVEGIVKSREEFYLPDLPANEVLLSQIQDTLKVPSDQVGMLRSWLGLPLIAKDSLIGFLVLAHSHMDAYSVQSRLISKAYANQVAVAIHNAQLYKQAGDNAALEERNRLARELHDSVAQALYSISLFVDATRMALKTNKPQVVENHLEELTQLSREAMSDMRLMIFELRPPVLERVGLVTALQSRLDSVEARAGFQASFHSEGEFHPSPEQESELYRIAQEALNNVIKHAHANRVSVQLIGEPGCLRLIIEDDGVGFDQQIAEHGGGQGFRNMRERASNIGASCSFESVPGRGTKITIEVNE